MLDVEAAVRIQALAYAPLAALIGQKLIPDEAPQATDYPMIVYSKVDDIRESNLDDDQRGISGFAISRLQFISLAKDTQSFRTAKLAHKYLFEALHGFRGIVSNNASPQESLFIQRIEFSGGFSDNRSKTQSRVVESVLTVTHAERPPS